MILFFCCYFIQCSIEQQIDVTNDLIRYKNACTYILNDNKLEAKDVFISGTINDIDRRIFQKDVLENEYKTTLDSLIKYHWFESFQSEELEELFGRQQVNSENILFFSSIEKNTLRADLFINRFSRDYFSYEWTTGEKIYAYLFFFENDGAIKKVFKKEAYYEGPPVKVVKLSPKFPIPNK